MSWGTVSLRSRFRLNLRSAFEESSRQLSPCFRAQLRTSSRLVVSSGRMKPSSVAGRIPAKPVRPGTAQQPEQHGLGLVAAGVSQRHTLEMKFLTAAEKKCAPRAPRLLL